MYSGAISLPNVMYFLYRGISTLQAEKMNPGMFKENLCFIAKVRVLAFDCIFFRINTVGY